MDPKTQLDAAREVADPVRLPREMAESPDWQAETARTASGFQRLAATGGGGIASVKATEAETLPKKLDRISNPVTRH